MAKYSVEDTTLTAIADAIRAKEGSADPIPANTFAERIAAIQTGAQLPALTNPAAAENIQSGYQVIDADGNVLTGTMQKVYQITNNTGLSFPSSAEAGSIVKSASASQNINTSDFIVDCDLGMIPFIVESSTSGASALLFVMPAGNVTIDGFDFTF